MFSTRDLGVALHDQPLSPSLSLEYFFQPPPVQLQAFAELKDLPDHRTRSSGCNLVIYTVNVTSFTVSIYRGKCRLSVMILCKFI